MRKYLFFLLIFSPLLYTAISVDVNYVYVAGRDFGDYSPKQTAQPQLDNIHPDYYVCGIDLLQTNWVVSLWNCHCGNRWYRWRKRWRCNWCDNWFWSETSQARVIFCHKHTWENQRTQIFSTEKTSTRNWREVRCPKNQYASGISIRLGSQNGVDTAFVGLQLRCENIDFTQKSFVQDDYGHPLTEMSKNPAKTFLSGLQFRYLKNDRLTGIKAYFGQNILPQAVSIEYGKVELVGEKVLRTIDTIEQENRNILATPYTIKFAKEYNVSGSWTNDKEEFNSIQISDKTVIPRPAVEGVKIEDNVYYKVTGSSPFQFKVCQSTTYSPVGSVPTTIPYCNVEKGVAMVEQQKVRATYKMTLKYVIPSTNEIVYRNLTGVYEGVANGGIKTDTVSLPIPGCQED